MLSWNGFLVLRALLSSAEAASVVAACNGAAPGAIAPRDAEGILVRSAPVADPALAPVYARLLALAGDVLGRPARLLEAQTRLRPPGSRIELPLHREEMAFRASPRSGQDCVSLWVALSDEGTQQGGLALFSGSHQAVRGRQRAEKTAVPPVRPRLDAGDTVVLLPQTLYSSAANDEAESRWVLLLRYQAASSAAHKGEPPDDDQCNPHVS